MPDGASPRLADLHAQAFDHPWTAAEIAGLLETPGTFVSPCTLDEHFHTRILPSFKILSKYVMNPDFQVYNLSSTSRIPAELVPRVTFEDVDRMIGA